MPSRIEPGQADETDGTQLLERLNQPKFDPVDFLNNTLPSLNLSSQSHPANVSRSTQIQGAATDSLALLSSINTISIRSSSELTALTDEIIRSGNRLAYEVEVLRGDVNGFHETLTDTLREDIAQFVRDEVSGQGETPAIREAEEQDTATTIARKDEPDFMARLRLLAKVKSRLESVVAVFGEAMKWPVPPSEVSGAALISVSAPELGIQSTAEDDRAREVLKQMRGEIIDLMGPESAGFARLDAAAQKVESYRQLATLWKGTGEEKARLKFVEALAKLVEDRRKILEAKEAGRIGRSDGSARSGSALGRASKGAHDGGGGGAAGLFRNLQRFKDDLYLE
jgi:hypothetical protein